VPEIRLSHDDAPAEMCEALGHVPDCIRILIQSDHVGATFKHGFAVTTAATRGIEKQQTCFRF
jgi:hypothetical protein